MSDTEDPFEQMARVINANAKVAAQLDAAAKAISASANTTAAEARRAVESVRAAVAGLSPEGAAKAFSEALAGVKRDAGTIAQAAKRLEDAANSLNRAGWEGMGRLILYFLCLLAGLAALVMVFYWWEEPKIERHFYGCEVVKHRKNGVTSYGQCQELQSNPNG